MKLRTLALWQIIISIVIFLGFLYNLANAGFSAYEIGRALGENTNILLLALVVLLTGIYNLKQKK